ncbi:MAG: DEAD/DEAH box helicase family protein [Kouleothrix sp.]|nr:DEAD/DEAH box helicase family protein [Kouleothrix sp.]
MSEPTINAFYREYNLTTARAHQNGSSVRQPAGHQRAALTNMHRWFDGPVPTPTGGMLVLPTGGGKTFTALRFLCAGPLSQGYKVLWLAHTHHLLEQALESLEHEIGQIGEPKSDLYVRIVSGTPGHCRVHEIKPTDDIVICTLQTLTQAHRIQHPQLMAFLREAGDKLFVVFDEAHHAPAHSYRTLITGLRDRRPGMSLLGLTATPLYNDEQKNGWLRKIFPQEIIYQVTPTELMAAGILAKPIFEDHRTEFSTDFSEREYEKWRGTYRDLPEDMITRLAESRERNLFIAQTYVENQARYGKTIIFADRWFQCEQLREFLAQRGVRVGTVYTRVDASPSTVEARNRRDPNANKLTLEQFKRGDLQVLINVRMLTEGTDVPDIQTVFLTRQTTSTILLTQMIGRALRGGKFGGTDHAYIVSFIDNWKHLINWADYSQLGTGPLGEESPSPTKRPPVHLVSIDLVRRLARHMDTGIVPVEPFLTLLPEGWYRVEFFSVVEGSDDLATIQQMIMVYDNEIDAYRQFIEALQLADLGAFGDENVDIETQQEQLLAWQRAFFAGVDERIGGDLLRNLFHIARHIAQNDNVAPIFFPFEERKNHDLDAVALQFMDTNLSRREEHEALLVEYRRADRYWSILYPNLGLFKAQYNACCEGVFARFNAIPDKDGGGKIIEPMPYREPSQQVKDQVKGRDNYCCLSCGENMTRLLQIDHVAPSYLGGSNAPDNLQTLCRICNNHKGGINTINFRNHRTLLAGPPVGFPTFEMPWLANAGDPFEWEKYLRRSINFFYRCAAVDSITIRQRGQYFYNWEVYLHAGNDPEWMRAHLAILLQRIRERRGAAGRQGPQRITIAAPDVLAITHAVEQP